MRVSQAWLTIAAHVDKYNELNSMTTIGSHYSEGLTRWPICSPAAKCHPACSWLRRKRVYHERTGCMLMVGYLTTTSVTTAGLPNQLNKSRPFLDSASEETTRSCLPHMPIIATHLHMYTAIKKRDDLGKDGSPSQARSGVGFNY